METDEKIFEGLDLKSEFLCSAAIFVAENSPGPIGTPWGMRMLGYISWGEFEGPKLKGRVLEGGGDWITMANDNPGRMKPDVRAVWETHDGAKLYLTYTGRIIQPAPSADGTPRDPSQVDPSEYYFRVAPTFETADDRYAWLNEVQAIGVGRFLGGGIAYRIYAIT
jgi:hypothetical protein